jgi:hypothetical protein
MAGLQLLLNETVAKSAVLSKVCAVSTLDSSLPSSVILDRVNSNYLSCAKEDCKRILNIGLAIGVGVVAFKIAKFWWISHKKQQDFISKLGCDTFSEIAKDISEDAEDEEEEEVSNIQVGEIDIGVPQPKHKNRHRNKRFTTKLVHMTKNHFGGCPDPSKSNVMAVSKFVYEKCKEHGCLPHQTRMLISVVVPLVLSPDQYDISSKALLNSMESCENRAALERHKSIDSWLTYLVCHPLTVKAWKRAIDNLLGLPDWKAFRLVN